MGKVRRQARRRLDIRAVATPWVAADPVIQEVVQPIEGARLAGSPHRGKSLAPVRALGSQPNLRACPKPARAANP